MVAAVVVIVVVVVVVIVVVEQQAKKTRLILTASPCGRAVNGQSRYQGPKSPSVCIFTPD